MKVTVYHNPNCGTSRNVVALLRGRGIEPQIIEYLKTPPSKEDLKALVKRSGLKAQNFLRSKEKLYAELRLEDAKWTEDDLLGHLASHPILLNRPVVVTPKGAKPCRPAEMVLELLDEQE